jgi:hypothetical protein
MCTWLKEKIFLRSSGWHRWTNNQSIVGRSFLDIYGISWTCPYNYVKNAEIRYHVQTPNKREKTFWDREEF